MYNIKMKRCHMFEDLFCSNGLTDCHNHNRYRSLTFGYVYLLLNISYIIIILLKNGKTNLKTF